MISPTKENGGAASPLASQLRPVMVVGASGDIGQEVAMLLQRRGHHLSLTRTPGREIPYGEWDSTTTRWTELDVTDSDAVRSVVEQEIAFHGEPLDLVYAAGIVRDSPTILLPDEAWRAVIDVNLSGAFYCIRALLRPMMVAQRGSIVLIGSLSAHKASLGQTAYASAKAGLEALCRSVAQESGRYGIRCNVVAPGAIESRMMRRTAQPVVERTIKGTPLRRLGTADDVAEAAIYLLSDQASFVSGAVLAVDGGLAVI